ncbi:tRNA (guanosine(46)-N7)-methyltransferase TrmB [Hydrotalea sp.]|uniref:tRNA (guanosine(46)-N7)-methyltransferase TrmB n=1 Tax=Hydrotalea sp. TaxID=2881279 RepID=UPI00263883B7|nr:tRNA (guanosine(46)-N7)-methyltransferase TrmB [Hydrotalea sp.]
MAHKKLIRFKAIKSFPNVFELPENMQDQWAGFFKNNHPLVLELACGKGEYTIGLAKLYPQKNYIGVDVKGNRIWRGALTALEENLTNVAFLRTPIEMIHQYFIPHTVEAIWITFPDPQLRLSKAKKRLTHPRFLRLYQQILQPNGIVFLKTDSPDLYRFTKTVINLFQLELLQDFDNMYAAEGLLPEHTIKTHYELLDIAQSNRIHFLAFRVNQTLQSQKDEILKKIIVEHATD